MARKADITLRLYRPEDEIGVGNVITMAYERAAQARRVKLMRDAGDMAVELLALRGNSVVGYIGFSKLAEPHGWMALAPLAVMPTVRSGGIGSDLVRYGLDHARRAGAKAITVLGDARYYMRFGFTFRSAENLKSPYGGRLLLYPIAPGTAFADTRLVFARDFDGPGAAAAE